MASLPDRPDIGQLRTQAKELKRAFEQGDPSASKRVLQSHPKFAGLPSERLEHWHLGLRDAQIVIARELGFRSWNDLLTEVDPQAGPRWDSSRSQDIQRRAFQEAKTLRQGFCTDDHFLLALLNPPQPTAASTVLHELGLTYEGASEHVAVFAKKKRRDRGTPSTPAFQLVLGWSQGIALGMNATEVTDEHVLLALVFGDLMGESSLLRFDVDPEEVVSALKAKGVNTPSLTPPTSLMPLRGPYGPWVYFPVEQFQAVTQEVARRHPPGSIWWGTNKSKWKKGYWYVHGEDEIPMEEIVRSVVKDKGSVEVLSFSEGIGLESASAPRRYRDKPSV